MTEIGLLSVVLAFVAGGLLALGFLLALRRAIDALPRARHPAVYMLGSMILRLAVVLIAFYLLTVYAGWPQAVAALAGFATARFFVLRRLRTAA